MKIQTIVLLIALMVCVMQNKSVESGFLEQELSEYGSLKVWINNYLDAAPTVPLADNLKAFSY